MKRTKLQNLFSISVATRVDALMFRYKIEVGPQECNYLPVHWPEITRFDCTLFFIDASQYRVWIPFAYSRCLHHTPSSKHYINITKSQLSKLNNSAKTSKPVCFVERKKSRFTLRDLAIWLYNLHIFSSYCALPLHLILRTILWF